MVMRRTERYLRGYPVEHPRGWRRLHGPRGLCMPATASLEILWSKASFEGNWLIQPAQLGDIDTSHVASTELSGGGDDGTGGTMPRSTTRPTY